MHSERHRCVRARCYRTCAAVGPNQHLIGRPAARKRLRTALFDNPRRLHPQTKMNDSLSIRCAAFVIIALSATACGPNPEKAGDECDKGDGCPDDMVCASSGGGDICQIKAGGSCDVGGKDYCLKDAVCADDGLGGGTCGTKEGTTCDPDKTVCAGNMSCAEHESGEYLCRLPVNIKGKVFDAETAAGIKAAQIVALDEQSTALTDVAESDETGNYILDLPVLRMADGTPVTTDIVTLRASARDYQTFPGGLRTALPIHASEMQKTDTGWVIQSALTDIGLIGLPADQRGHASISGTVKAGDMSAGVLVVAESGMAVAPSGVSDRHGVYTIFNVPDGAVTVRGYKANLQLTPVDKNVAGADMKGVDLLKSDAALGTIAGQLAIVDAPGGSLTSVVLVPASTFNETFKRGEVPQGLRTPLMGPPNVSGTWTIVNVPAGTYKVLAAFENDELVRDPDLNIAGTQIVSVDMPSPGTTVQLAETFKITEALDVIGPGTDAPEAVTGNVTLTWQDDASEDSYEVVVFNALGEVVWCHSDHLQGCVGGNLPPVSGSATASIAYDGPLDPGMYYQFRATSWRGTSAISSTEDLRGVFFVPTQ